MHLAHYFQNMCQFSVPCKLRYRKFLWESAPCSVSVWLSSSTRSSPVIQESIYYVYLYYSRCSINCRYIYVFTLLSLTIVMIKGPFWLLIIRFIWLNRYCVHTLKHQQANALRSYLSPVVSQCSVLVSCSGELVCTALLRKTVSFYTVVSKIDKKGLF